MTRFWKYLRLVLVTFTAVASALLAFAALMSDRLTTSETLERIMAADEPCRAAYAKVLELREAQAPEAEWKGAARAGEPVCRASFTDLDGINFFISPSGGSTARDKQAVVDRCATLSRVRADLLTGAGAVTQSASRLTELNDELAQADRACQDGFQRLAR